MTRDSTCRPYVVTESTAPIADMESCGVWPEKCCGDSCFAEGRVAGRIESLIQQARTRSRVWDFDR